MTNIEQIVNYVTETPNNTNKRALRKMLNGLIDDHINILFQPQKTLEELSSTLPNKSLFVCKDISDETNLIVFKQNGDEPDDFDFETSHFSVKSNISFPFSLNDPQAYSVTSVEGYINGSDDKVACALYSTFITSSQTASGLSFLSDVQSENGFMFLQGEDSEDSRAIIFVIDDDIYIYVTANFTGNLMLKSDSTINAFLEDLTLAQGWNKITSFNAGSTPHYTDNSPIDDINNDLNNISMTGQFFTEKVGSSEASVPTIFEWEGQNFEEVLGYTFLQDGENINYSILCTANPSTFEIDSNNVLRNSTISL